MRSKDGPSVTVYRRWPAGPPSMRRYADGVVAALSHQGLAVRDVFGRDASIPTFADTGGAMGRKLLAYAYIYGYYPLLARGLQGDINHITEHHFAHLLRGVDPSRSVITCHDLMHFVRPGLFRPPAAGPLVWPLLRRSLGFMPKAACIVTDSACTRRDVLRLTQCDPDRVQVVYPGLDVAFFDEGNADVRRRFRARHGLGEAFLMLHVGANEPYKNVEGVFAVLQALVQHQTPNVKLVKVGAPFTREQRMMIQREGLADRIIHVGHTSPPELLAAYRACDVLLFPSHYEGFGWPPLEAMASGLPVVCSDGGSLAEVVGEGALLAPSRDHAALTRAVKTIATETEARKALIARGRARAAQFQWVDTAHHLVDVYTRVEDERRRRRPKP